MADQLGQGFVHHDRRNREAAIEAFAVVDALQFSHLDDREAYCAADARVEALWAKDDLEDECRADGEVDYDKLAKMNWTPVREAFERRASVTGADPKYAELTAEGWRRHKVGGDYWTPMMHAQMLELRVALQDPSYPDKPREGQSGFGPEPARWALGVELHDTRRYQQAHEVMTPYFQRIIDAHDE
jgi:hypothetical protein